MSADSENIGIGISVAKAFQRIYNEHEWIPRRTLIFLISADYMDSCLYSLSSYDQSKIVAYLAIDKNPIDGLFISYYFISFITTGYLYVIINIFNTAGDGFFQIAGSDMVQTTVLEASRDYYNFNNSNDHVTDLQRLKIVIPHTLLSFYPVKNVSAAADKQNFSNLHRRTLAQVLSTSVWRLSEMTVFQWDPQILHTSIELLNKFNLPDSQGIQGTFYINEM